MNLVKSLLRVFCLLSSMAFVSIAASSAQPDEILASDLSEYIDKNTRPQDNFYRHVNGQWLETIVIPEDKALYGTLIAMNDENDTKLESLINSLSQASDDPDEKKLLALYQSFMNTAAIEKVGLKPLTHLKAIATAQSHQDILALMTQFSILEISTPIAYDVQPDMKNTDAYLLYWVQSGLSLPDRDYYMKAEAPYHRLVSELQVYFESLLEAAGITDAKKTAENVIKIEKALAKIHWPAVDNRDLEKIYNKVSIEDFTQKHVNLKPATVFKQLKIQPQNTFNITQPSYFKKLDDLLTQFSVSEWQDYLLVHTINHFAPFLSEAFEQLNFEYYGKLLQGKEINEPRAKRAVRLLNKCLPDLVGQRFVANHFHSDQMQAIQALVDNILQIFDTGIDQLTWMTDKTKVKAKNKLEHMTVKVGYPQKWKSYDGLEIKSDTILKNLENCYRFEWQRTAHKLGQSVDREEWFMPAQIINAYYDPAFNTIVFPAAILQPPVFSAEYSDARNYGGIGAVIGHEISHAFDDQGRKFDHKGNLQDWWEKEDAERFKAKTQGLVKQYNAFSPIEGMHVNGELTLGENIADLSGLSVSLKALRAIEGYQEQDDTEFLMSWARSWCIKHREGELRRRLIIDPHSPGEYRTNGVLRNLDAFYQTYQLQPSDQMYLPQEERVFIW